MLARIRTVCAFVSFLLIKCTHTNFCVAKQIPFHRVDGKRTNIQMLIFKYSSSLSFLDTQWAVKTGEKFGKNRKFYDCHDRPCMRTKTKIAQLVINLINFQEAHKFQLNLL